MLRIIKQIFDWITRPIGLWFQLPKPQTFYIKERFLFDTAGMKIILRGINLPLLDDWSFPPSDKLSELEKTGANAVRIQWYVDYGPRDTPYSLGDLDAFLTKCKNARIIPILMLADCTCEANTTLVNEKLVPWWIRPDVKQMLDKHKKYLILNLGNEVGFYRFAGSTPAALTSYTAAYKAAITSLRNAGYAMPLMIDAPDCGTTIGAFTAIGRELINHDPKRNILLSVHAYWAGYDGTPEIVKAVVSSTLLPIVFGEIANKQREGDDECYYGIDGTGLNHAPPTGFTYKTLLPKLGEYDIGWLAWCWWKDKCPDRQMTMTGNFANLTPYGSDIVTNPVYGLEPGTKYPAVRTTTLP